LSAGDEGLDSAFEDTALQKDAALALEALDTDVGTEPDHLPLIAAAGVFLLEAHDVAQLYLNNHCL
jgi:hypothetical protein